MEKLRPIIVNGKEIDIKVSLLFLGAKHPRADRYTNYSDLHSIYTLGTHADEGVILSKRGSPLQTMRRGVVGIVTSSSAPVPSGEFREHDSYGHYYFYAPRFPAGDIPAGEPFVVLYHPDPLKPGEIRACATTALRMCPKPTHCVIPSTKARSQKRAAVFLGKRPEEPEIKPFCKVFGV